MIIEKYWTPEMKYLNEYLRLKEKSMSYMFPIIQNFALSWRKIRKIAKMFAGPKLVLKFEFFEFLFKNIKFQDN